MEVIRLVNVTAIFVLRTVLLSLLKIAVSNLTIQTAIKIKYASHQHTNEVFAQAAKTSYCLSYST